MEAECPFLSPRIGTANHSRSEQLRPASTSWSLPCRSLKSGPASGGFHEPLLTTHQAAVRCAKKSDFKTDEASLKGKNALCPARDYRWPVLEDNMGERG